MHRLLILALLAVASGAAQISIPGTSVTIPSVSNLLAGDGAGGVADGRIAASAVVLGASTLTTTSQIPCVSASGTLGPCSAETAPSVTKTGLGTTTAIGVQVANTTAAANGAQQVSPSFRWAGRGWKTNATAASQSVEFRAYVLPVQGSAAPTGTWKLQSSINGGAFTDSFTIDSAGNAVATGTVEGVSAQVGARVHISSGSTGRILLASGMMYGWQANSTSTGSATSPDTAFSRVSAGVIGVGTGSAGSVAGTISTTGLIINGNAFTLNGKTCSEAAGAISCI